MRPGRDADRRTEKQEAQCTTTGGRDATDLAIGLLLGALSACAPITPVATDHCARSTDRPQPVHGGRQTTAVTARLPDVLHRCGRAGIRTDLPWARRTRMPGWWRRPAGSVRQVAACAADTTETRRALPVRVDSTTGSGCGAHLRRLRAHLDEAVTRYFLTHYITICERFNSSPPRATTRNAARFMARSLSRPGMRGGIRQPAVAAEPA